MRFIKVKITRDNNTVYSTSFAPWEIPVVEFIFGEGSVQVVGEFKQVGRDPLTPGQEFDRLTRRYGADRATGEPYVAKVYGNAGAGIRALADVMAKERAENPEPVVFPAETSVEPDPLVA